MDLIDIFGFFQVFSIAHTTSIAIAADNGYGNQSLLASRLLLIKKVWGPPPLAETMILVGHRNGFIDWQSNRLSILRI